MTIIMEGCSPEHWGFIPTFLSEDDPRPAKEQFSERYQKWNPFNGFRIVDKTGPVIQYPGDPPHRPIGKMHFRDETIILYPHAFVMIVQKDGSWEIDRMD